MFTSAVPFICSRSPTVIKFTSFQPLRDNFTNRVLLPQGIQKGAAVNTGDQKKLCNVSVVAARLNNRRKFSHSTTVAATSGGDGSVPEFDDNARKLLRALLWIAEGSYVIWLFLLPYAPGDPVWAISSETINSLIGLSLNFFFILPLCNSVGIHLLIESPVLHPMSEGLFNFVIGWTILFGPLLYTDKWRNKFKGSLDVLWSCQLFLTNTFLIPYMAIRLNDTNSEDTPRKQSWVGSIVTKRAATVGLIGGLGCILSIAWALYGRADANFGDARDRWEFLVSYVGNERLAYAFIWDICLYLLFQSWLIGDNLQNIQSDKVALVNVLRFIPVVGILAYCLCLNISDNDM